MEAIEKFLEPNVTGHWSSGGKPRIAVVGDAMVDEYHSVVANRVSPEFPIPVLRSDGSPPVRLPGGAANVCHQFKHFNMDVRLFSWADKYAKEVFEEHDITWSGFDLDEDKCLPIKRRYYDKDFPLCRLDVEKKYCGVLKHQLLGYQSNVFKSIAEFRPYVTIYSDYGKGLFANMNRVFQDDLAFSIVDPKDGPISRWKGCTLIKPNAEEARRMSGEVDWKKQCDYFQSETECMGVVITHGNKGVVGKIGEEDNYFEYEPERQVVADSVIGAGDCFVAFLAMCMAHQMDVMEAVEVAFEAGAIYVQRRHNKPISTWELKLHDDPIQGKFVKPADLVNRDYTLCFTNGCFDLLHAGHLSTLEFAKSKADKLVVGVDSDESVKAAKGEDRPIISIKDRMGMLANLECVDFVIEFNEETPYNLVQEIKPDVLVKGDDWAWDEVVGSDLVKEVHLAPTLDGISTTNIIENIRK